MNVFSKSGLKGKINLLVVLVAIVCATAVAMVSSFKSKDAIEQQVRGQLSLSAKMIKAKVQDYFGNVHALTSRLGKDRLVEGLFIAFEGSFYGGAYSQSGDNNIMNTTYVANEKLYGERIRKLSNDYGMKTIMLASINGQIVMNSAIDKEANFLGRNLKDGAFKNTAMSNCYQQAMASEGKDVYFAPFSFYQAASTVNSFMCVKMFAEFDHEDDGIYVGDPLGVVITEIDVNAINAILSEREGMGETGQFYLVGPDKKLRSNLHLNSEKFNVKNFFTNNLSIDIPIVTKAFESSGDGIEHTIGPNGHQVFAFYSKLNFSGNSWVIIAEKADEEIERPIWSMIKFIALISVAIVLIIILLSSFLSTKLAAPVIVAANSLRSISDEVLTNSNSVKVNSGDLSNYSTDLSGSLNQTVSTLDELTAMVNKNLENVSRSTDISEHSKNVAEEGLTTINRLMEAFKEINNANEQIVSEMDATIEKMNNISLVIKEIAGKTTLINDIVFQTKLLSFNASVEAARAGEHGKGFAVVAEEVGKLASASGMAAKDISEMVQDSVSNVEEIVQSTKLKISQTTEIGEEKVKTGYEIAKECGDKLDEILTNVNELNTSVAGVRVASDEQALGIKEVSKAMGTLEIVSNNSKNLSTDLLNVSEGMEEKSFALKGVVDNLDTLLDGAKEQTTQTLDNVYDVSPNYTKDVDDKKSA